MKALRLKATSLSCGYRVSQREEARQMEYISVDANKRYSFVSIENKDGKLCSEARVEHRRGAFWVFLNRRLPGSPVAVEIVGNWYWIVDEMEEAGRCLGWCMHIQRR
jgi:hypothetical protein